jgi:hypothetical protein
MHRSALILAFAVALAPSGAANAGLIEFSTDGSATQMIDSPLFGGTPITLTATGGQHFTFDTGTGVANVVANFNGNDLPNPFSPGSFWSYHLFNTTTAGTFTPEGGGLFKVTFPVLFELTITSGPLSGVSVVTKDVATFTADTTLPFQPGTIFGDPTRTSLPTSPDAVTIYAADTVPALFNAGDPVGISFDRTVLDAHVLPEPATLTLLGIAGVSFGGFTWLRRKKRVAC